MATEPARPPSAPRDEQPDRDRPAHGEGGRGGGESGALEGGDDIEVPMDAATLVGLLADPDRRRVVASLILGAQTTDDIRKATGLDARAAVNAVYRLADAGLVELLPDGHHLLFESAFRTAAVAAAAASAERQASDDASGSGTAATIGDSSEQAARVLRAFVRGNRLLQIPAQHSKRLVILDLLAQEFEPGERYSERIVNQILRRWHPDTAALRRYLVDEGFMERGDGEYWRAGGTYLPD